MSLFPRRFIEHGEYKENQYGTSIEAIRSVQAKNKMCVVDVQPEVGVLLQPLSDDHIQNVSHDHVTIDEGVLQVGSDLLTMWSV